MSGDDEAPDDPDAPTLSLHFTARDAGTISIIVGMTREASLREQVTLTTELLKSLCGLLPKETIGAISVERDEPCAHRPGALRGVVGTEILWCDDCGAIAGSLALDGGLELFATTYADNVKWRLPRRQL